MLLDVKYINVLVVSSKFIVVKSESYDEVIRNLHRYVVDRNVLFVCIRLHQKGTYARLLCAFVFEDLLQGYYCIS